MNPVQALREIGFLLERSRADTYRRARRAADAISKLSDEERRNIASTLRRRSRALGPKARR